MAGKQQPQQGEGEGFLSQEEADAKMAAARAGAIEPAAPRTFTFRGVAKTDDSVVAEDVRQLDFQQLSEIFGVVTADEAIGTDQYGPILEDKGKLVGVPLVFVHWEFYPGDFGEFVSVWVLTQNNDRYIVNDGSSGIYAQLRQLTNTKQLDSMLVAKHGLRVSTYDKELSDGKVIKDAQTFYVDTKL